MPFTITFLAIPRLHYEIIDQVGFRITAPPTSTDGMKKQVV
ncbi:MAG: hypothetical protein ACTSPQ_18015 [Candidatus Helarchaeota archaeon]